MRKQWFLFIVVILASITLWGCSNNRENNNSATISPVTVPDAELTGDCVSCHSLDVHVNNSGIAGTNPDAVNGTGSAITHDCEDCHGGGQYHNGDGPIPYPAPEGDRCAVCHPQANKVMASKHNGLDSSDVAMINDGHNDTRYCQRCHTAEGSIAFRDIIGDKSTLNSTIVAYNTAVGPGQVEALPNRDASGNQILHMPVCGTCHNPLTASLVEFDSAVWDPNANGVSDQFDLCTSCHNYYTNSGQLFGSGSDASGTAEYFHNNSWYRNITTTHYDDPATGFQDDGSFPPDGINDQNVAIEGYVIRTQSENPCFDCHGHELKTNTAHADDLDGSGPDRTPTPYNMWAKSGHAGHLLDTVIAAVNSVVCDPLDPSYARGKCNDMTDAAMAAVVSDTTGPAWSHYNWDESRRSSCQMCHTATGAANFLTDPANYDPANNDYSHLDSWDVANGSPQNEMLYCWGCHSNAAEGELRNPGSIPRPYTVGGVTVEIADVGKSNVCINCHGGRGNSEGYGLTGDPATLMNSVYPDYFGANVKNVTATHYLAAAATLYAADTRVGYEYYNSASQKYAPKSYFRHVLIGLNGDSPESGSGPCAACHMQHDQGHLFAVVEKDSSGVITALKSTVCIACHTGSHGSAPAFVAGDAAAADFLQGEAEGFHEALEILETAMGSVGVTYTGSYPYFNAANWINEGVFGAAHNFIYLHHEPGAYAHNRFYTKRLIFDSIDWLDNYVLNGSIAIDEVAYPEAAHWFGWDGASAGFVATRP